MRKGKLELGPSIGDTIRLHKAAPGRQVGMDADHPPRPAIRMPMPMEAPSQHRALTAPHMPRLW